MVVIQIFVLVVFLCIAFSVPISIGFLALPNDGMLAILGLLACFVALVLGLGDRMLLFYSLIFKTSKTINYINY